eukprot:CAMPEP_0194388088 /NCGR_PEP_ID=MMETSP0174-20130528/96429_1 /TAXON_ID=216777 /ORGANISM="Proboscia alata, Strain PI-D3" /LENGTH=33 /DNA_ID= /DNA_START= /DNA_END= /DNA_ORIENTATION=
MASMAKLWGINSSGRGPSRLSFKVLKNTGEATP